MNNSFSNELKSQVVLIVLIGTMFAVTAFFVYLFNEKEYKASIDFIILQDQINEKDLYSLSRSIEYVVNVLSASFYSGDFIDKMNEEGESSDEFISMKKSEQIKQWSKTLRVKENLKSGIINVEIYGSTQSEVSGLANGFTTTVTEKKYLFENNDNLKIKVLSGPIVEKNPSLEKVIVVTAGGFGLGVIISIMIVFYSYQRKDLKRIRNFGNLSE